MFLLLVFLTALSGIEPDTGCISCPPIHKVVSAMLQLTIYFKDLTKKLIPLIRQNTFFYFSDKKILLLLVFLNTFWNRTKLHTSRHNIYPKPLG
jgi:hypothetical protein